jgi:hypothetical protein
MVAEVLPGVAVTAEMAGGVEVALKMTSTQ